MAIMDDMVSKNAKVPEDLGFHILKNWDNLVSQITVQPVKFVLPAKWLVYMAGIFVLPLEVFIVGSHLTTFNSGCYGFFAIHIQWWCYRWHLNPSYLWFLEKFQYPVTLPTVSPMLARHRPLFEQVNYTIHWWML